MTGSRNKITRPITLEGQEYALAIDLNFYHTFEEMTGRDLLSGATPADWRPNAKEMIAMMTAAIQSGGSEITAKEVGRILHTGNMEYAFSELQALMKANNPSTNGTDPLAANPAEEGAPTG